MSADSVVTELASLLKSGMPAESARAELSVELSSLSERQLAQLDLVWQLAMTGGGSVAEAIASLCSMELPMPRSLAKARTDIAFTRPPWRT